MATAAPLLGLTMSTLIPRAAAQLAITEVLPEPLVAPVAAGADYWELTNFGPDPVDLSDYWFSDDSGFAIAVNLGQALGEFPAMIRPNESIIFTRANSTSMPDADAFRTWWGPDRLPDGLRVSVVPWRFGFNNTSDSIQLWKLEGDTPRLVDVVSIIDVSAGAGLAYDPLTGLRRVEHRLGQPGAVQAALNGDIGSPGNHAGPVTLQWVSLPQATEVDAGSPLTLTALAHGLPRPEYQWLHNGEPIPGATSASWRSPNAAPTDAGTYSVEVRNGLQQLTSPEILITINQNPRPAEITVPPSAVEVTFNQTAIFTVETRGYPIPEIQWLFNGDAIFGATSNRLEVPNCGVNQQGLYTVIVANAYGETNASATLTVVDPPRLVITEAMASPTNAPSNSHNDWWELTNLDSRTVNLRGYRFNDTPGSLFGAVTNQADILLRPGQSAIWVSDMSADAFRRWWGEENLPEDLPIITYIGNGFSSFPADMVRLWNGTALENGDAIDSKSFINDTPGRSLWFDEIECPDGCLSEPGLRGAFRAAESDDVGSPGWTSNAQRVVRPRITGLAREGSSLRLSWKAEPGRRYEIRSSDQPAGGAWSTVAQVTASATTASHLLPVSPGSTHRFYRVYRAP